MSLETDSILPVVEVVCSLDWLILIPLISDASAFNLSKFSAFEKFVDPVDIS